MSRPANFCVLKAPGINCEVESARAVVRAGGTAEIVHVNQLIAGDRNLSNYQGFFIPGGFSEGDAVRAGIVLALQLKERLGDPIRSFADAGKPVLGICNGFQTLVEMGLLPGDGDSQWEKTASLRPNASGQFESRWVNLNVNRGALSPFVPDIMQREIQLPIANGEGQFVASEERLAILCRNGQVLLYYADPEGRPSMDPEHNPSGSSYGIAAICNDRGNVMGSMPHIERCVEPEHAPDHRRPETITQPHGLAIVRSIVEYAAGV